MRILRPVLAAIAGVFLMAAPAWAEGAPALTKVDLELVLALDSSGSVDVDEWQLQLDGVAKAIRDPLVMHAIQSGPNRRIAVAILIWADALRHKERSDWFLIDSPESAEIFALMIDATPRTLAGETGIGAAVTEAVSMLRYNEFDAPRQVIDVSGDGIETPAPPYRLYPHMLSSARRLATSFGITVNGLAIANDVPDLDEYFREELICGSGSFAMKTNDYVGFHSALREKLVREILAPIAGNGTGLTKVTMR